MASQEPNTNDTNEMREDEEPSAKQPQVEKTFVDVKRKYTDRAYERLHFPGVTKITHCDIIDAIKENFEKFHFPPLDSRIYVDIDVDVFPGNVDAYNKLLIFDATSYKQILSGYKVESGSKIEVTRACEYQRARFLRKINREYLEDEQRMLAEVRYQINERKRPFLLSLTDEETNMVNYPEI